jgi:hypothetical protein
LVLGSGFGFAKYQLLSTNYFFFGDFLFFWSVGAPACALPVFADC